MDAKQTKLLKKLIVGTGVAKLRALAIELIDRLHESEDIGIYEDDDGHLRVYWDASGDDLFD